MLIALSSGAQFLPAADTDGQQSQDRPAAVTPETSLPDVKKAPSPDAKDETPAAATTDGTPATVIDDREVEGILGKSVQTSAGEDMGRIVDVIVKRTGQVRAAVIDFGGFLGVGSRKIAVDWDALRFPPTGTIDHIILELTRDQVRLAPEYRPGEPVVVLGSAGAEPPMPKTPEPQPKDPGPKPED
jgi:sporulation protein YlmC with PRC-barrel domain